MKHTLLFFLSLVLAMPALAQANPDRASGDFQDVVWARDIGSATITLDGTLNEPEWAQAESIVIKWDDPAGGPGSGQFNQVPNPNGVVDPVDPIDATVSFLRKGSQIYIAVNAKDKSVGGSHNLWNIDGIMMPIVHKSNQPDSLENLNGYGSFGVTEEFIYSWWSNFGAGDTTATGGLPVGISPRARTRRYGSGLDTGGDLNRDVFDVSHSVIGGIANDDLNGGAAADDDEGYIFEMMINADSLGWDMTEPMARMPFAIFVQDSDYNWPQDGDKFATFRAWWQNRWGNNFNHGIAYIAADPSVTVSSGDAPVYDEPEFTVWNGVNEDEPTVDGQLSEDAWGKLDPQFQLQYRAPADSLDAWLPGVLAPVYTFWFHPDQNDVEEASRGIFRMFYKDSKLWVGLDVDDDAIRGVEPEGGRDGFRLQIRSRDSTASCCEFTAADLRMDFSIDETGAMRFTNVSEEIEVGTDLMGAVALKGASTVEDAGDIDTGYQMEVSLDLTSIGYPADLDDEKIWIALTYFDGDLLPDSTLSYGTRTWIAGERSNTVILQGLLDSNAIVGVASEDDATESGFRSLGSAPNPSSGLTQLRYELPRASEVTVEVFDVLGRRVQMVKAGLQDQGLQSTEIDGSALSAGSYIYRVTMKNGPSVTGRMTIVR